MSDMMDELMAAAIENRVRKATEELGRQLAEAITAQTLAEERATAATAAAAEAKQAIAHERAESDRARQRVLALETQADDLKKRLLTLQGELATAKAEVKAAKAEDKAERKQTPKAATRVPVAYVSKVTGRDELGRATEITSTPTTMH